MARALVSQSDDHQRWTLDGSDQWTDELDYSGHFRAAMLNSFSVIVSGTFSGTPLVQIRRNEGDSWQTVDADAFTADTPGMFNGEFSGKFQVRAGFSSLTGGSATVTVQR